MFVCISSPSFTNLYQFSLVLVTIILKMKETTESYLGTLVTNSVIAVPTYFNNSERNILQIINKPTVAAITYGVEKKVISKCSLFILDLGRGREDFKVKVTTGNTYLVCISPPLFANLYQLFCLSLLKKSLQ